MSCSKMAFPACRRLFSSIVTSQEDKQCNWDSLIYVFKSQLFIFYENLTFKHYLNIVEATWQRK
jgi:hypothetical protein